MGYWEANFATFHSPNFGNPTDYYSDPLHLVDPAVHDDAPVSPVDPAFPSSINFERAGTYAVDISIPITVDMVQPSGPLRLAVVQSGAGVRLSSSATVSDGTPTLTLLGDLVVAAGDLSDIFWVDIIDLTTDGWYSFDIATGTIRITAPDRWTVGRVRWP